MFRSGALGLLLCLVATSVSGQADLVGKAPGGFSAGKMVNEVAAKTLDDCRGEVILIKYWGTR